MSYEFTLELKPHIAMSVENKPVKHDQWYVVVQGRQVALLPFAKDSRLMPVTDGLGLGADEWAAIRERCVEARKAILNDDSDVLPPHLEQIQGVIKLVKQEETKEE